MLEKKRTYYKIVNYLIRRFQERELIPSIEERNALWQEICREADKAESFRRKRLHARIFSIGTAASFIAVILSASWILFSKDRSANIEDIAVKLLSETHIRETSNHSLLVISPDEIIPLQNHTKVEYSADGEVSLNSQNKKNQVTKNKATQSQYNQIIVPKGQHTCLRLADGSELHINSGSKVVYPSEFNGKQREIFIDGEIFIDVKQDEKQPFYVKTSSFEVKVLGTAFNVCAYSQTSSAEVVLLRGCVQIKDKEGNNMKLQPNQLAQIENKRLSDKREVDANAYVSWTRGLLFLKNETLENLLPKLEQYYGISITCDESAKGLDIHGCLDINCPLSEVLNRISISAPIRIEEENGNYHIHTEKEPDV